MNERDLRDCFGLFATGVMVACARSLNESLDRQIQNHSSDKISSNNDDELYGITVNSFSSVSLEPPILLFSIDNRSYNLQAFLEAKTFSLNILSIDQLNIAQEFARAQNHKKWDIVRHSYTDRGNPIFKDSLGFFECEKYQVIQVGDHHIFLGKIINFAKFSSKKPLLYFGSKFADLTSI